MYSIVGFSFALTIQLDYSWSMDDYLFLGALAGVLLVGAMSPGPSFLVVAKNSLTQSRSHGIATALGTGLGVALFAILGSFGVAVLLEKVPSIYLSFKILGGLYLGYLAWKIWRGADQELHTQKNSSEPDITIFKAFLMGLVTQTSNPKTALVIAGVYAAFVPEQPPPNTAWLVAGIAFVIDFSWYASVAVSLSSSRSKRIYERAKCGFDRTAAIFLGAVGLKLLVSSPS